MGEELMMDSVSLKQLGDRKCRGIAGRRDAACMGDAENKDHPKRGKGSKVWITLTVFFVLATIGLLIGVIVLAAKEAESEHCDPNPCKNGGECKTIEANSGFICKCSEGWQGYLCEDQSMCSTPGCIQAANQLLNNMDFAADPCDDFYRYACGGWLDHEIIPEESSRYSTFDILRDDLEKDLKGLLETELDGWSNSTDMAKEVYATCMDVDTIDENMEEPLENFLEEFGGWPLTNPIWEPDTFDFSRTTGEIRNWGSSYLIAMSINLDSFNSSIYKLFIDQPSLGLPGRDYYLHDAYQKYVEAYKTFILTVAHIMNNGSSGSDIESAVDNIIEFETIIANITTPPENRRNATAMYNERTMAQLMNDYSNINWETYFSKALPSDMNLNNEEKFILREPNYFEQLNNLLGDGAFDDQVVADYLIWRTIQTRAWHLDKRFRDAEFEYFKVVNGIQSSRPRWRDCVSFVQDRLFMAAGSLYVRAVFPEEYKVQAEDMIRYIHTAFKGMINELDWMSDPTKDVSIEKADAIREFIGYPDYIIEPEKLDEDYVGLKLTKEHFTNYNEYSRWYSNKNFRELNNPVDKSKWIGGPAIVNAWYSPSRNSITFPAGILQKPFYGGDQPMSMNFGGIGMVIGHEITHGFDDQGRQYDKDGNIFPWWSDDDIANFQEEAQCIVDQYSTYSVEIDGETYHLNGENTQGENIADNGGIKEAFRGYKAWESKHGTPPPLPGLPHLSHDQLFFINQANVWCEKNRDAYLINRILTGVHSPGYFRVIGPMSNFDEFSKAFSCPLNSTMNPQHKCAVW